MTKVQITRNTTARQVKLYSLQPPLRRDRRVKSNSALANFASLRETHKTVA